MRHKVEKCATAEQKSNCNLSYRTHLSRCSAVPSNNLHNKPRRYSSCSGASASYLPAVRFPEEPHATSNTELSAGFVQNHIFASVTPAGVTSGWQDDVRRVGGHQQPRKYLPIAAPLCSVRNCDGIAARMYTERTGTMDSHWSSSWTASATKARKPAYLS